MYGSPSFTTAPSVVKSSYKSPKKLDASGEQFTKVGQYDQKHWNAKNSVYYSDSSTRGSSRRYMAIS